MSSARLEAPSWALGDEATQRRMGWAFSWALVGFTGLVLLSVSSTEFEGLLESRVTLAQFQWLVLLGVAGSGYFFARPFFSGATAVLSATLAAGSLAAAGVGVAALVRLPLAGEFETPAWRFWLDELWSLLGCAMLLLGSAGILAWVARYSLAAARRPSQSGKSAFRIEAVVLAVFLSVGMSQTVSSVGSHAAAWAVSSIIVPAVLIMTLREPGEQSLGLAVGLAITTAVFPLLDLLSNGDGAEAFDVARVSLTTLPIGVLLILVIVLWNLRSTAVASDAVATPRQVLDTWAGAAFIMSFVPILAIPAIVIGHITYERLKFSGAQGRLIAASAIVLGLTSVGLVVLWSVVTLQIVDRLAGLGG